MDVLVSIHKNKYKMSSKSVNKSQRTTPNHESQSISITKFLNKLF